MSAKALRQATITPNQEIARLRRWIAVQSARLNPKAIHKDIRRCEQIAQANEAIAKLLLALQPPVAPMEQARMDGTQNWSRAARAACERARQQQWL